MEGVAVCFPAVPLELLLGQLEAPMDDKDVQTVIHNAFHIVEEKFFESLEDNTSPTYNANSRGEFIFKSSAKQDPMAGGTTAAMVIYRHGKLYFAHCGDCVAVLCQLTPDGVFSVRPLGILHNIESEDEALRLANMGLNVAELQQKQPHMLTRCIGNYALKKCYQSFDVLREAATSPITCDPDIIGGLPVGKSFRGFFYLMSSGLYRSWKECTGSENIEEDIAKLIATQLCFDKSLTDVANAVLGEICKRHAAAYAAGNGFFRRDEMTLLIRNFGLDRDDIKTPSPPPRAASDSGFLSTLNSTAPVGLRRSASELQMDETLETDSDSVASLRPADLDDTLWEYIDPYVDFADLASLDTDFEWSDSE